VLVQCPALAHLDLGHNRIEVKITAASADKRREKEIARAAAEEAAEKAPVIAEVRRRKQERNERAAAEQILAVELTTRVQR
jgi:hypothetical protein